MSQRNNTVKVHIANGDVSALEDPRHVKKIGTVEFVTTDRVIYHIVVTNPQGKRDAELYTAPLVTGPWRAHGKEKDNFSYTIEILFPKKSRRKKIRKPHTIIIDGGTETEKHRRKPARKKAAKRAHTIIIHS